MVRWNKRWFFICFSLLIILFPVYPASTSSFVNTTVDTSKNFFSKGNIINSDGTPLLIHRNIVITLLIFIIGYLLMLLFVRLINRRVEDIRIRHILRKNVVYLFTFIIILAVSFVWIRSLNSITIFLSLISAGIALALQEVILCVAGWLLILIRKPFEIGDRIELGGIKGDVIDIRLFQTSLLEVENWVEAEQSTGRVVNVPNSFVFKEANYNYSKGFRFIWNEIKIMVTFESNWRKAESIMLKHALQENKGMEEIFKRELEEMSRHYMIYYGKYQPIVYVDIKDSGVELSLRYLTEARKRRISQDKICRAILDDFSRDPEVNFAYTTYRIVK